MVLIANATSPVPVTFPPEGVFVLESRHRRGFRMEETVHDYWKVLLVFQGGGYLLSGSLRRPISKGDVAVLPPGVAHSLQDSGKHPLSLYGVCVQKEFLKHISSTIGISGNLRVYSHPVWASELAGILRSLLIEQSQSAPGSPAWITGLTWQIIGLIWRAEVRKRDPKPTDSSSTSGSVARHRVGDYARQLPQNFHKEAGVNEAAERLGLSRRRFTQLFREVAGDSWLQVVLRLRIEHAKQLLQGTSRSVTAVGFESGFSDLSHFYRIFRQFTGASPEAWRVKASGGICIKKNLKSRN